MANLKISELTAAGALTGTELVEVVQGGVNKQTTAQDIADLGGGGAVDSVNGATGTVVLDAGDIEFTPAGTISATTVQAAIEEVASEAGAGVSDGDKGDVVVSSSGTVWTVESASESAAGKSERATQAETNTGSDDARHITPLKLKNRDGDVTALVDGATIDITSDKCSLTTSSATRTFTISHTGDEMVIIVTLNTTGSVFTFPATALTVSEGAESGNNTASLAGVSGDKYVVSIKKVSTAYYVVVKSFGQ